MSVFIAGIHRIARLSGGRLLDIGCGEGSLTIPLGEEFEEVHGIDVQAANIDGFFARLDGDQISKYSPHLSSAARLAFPDGYFDAIISIDERGIAQLFREVCGIECGRDVSCGNSAAFPGPCDQLRHLFR